MSFCLELMELEEASSQFTPLEGQLLTKHLCDGAKEATAFYF